MIYVKVAILLICAELWYQGGQNNRAWMRDVLITIILGAWVGWKSVWWIGILTIGTFNIIRIGYGIPDSTDEGSFLGRIFKVGWLTRGVAGTLYGLVGLLGYVIYTHHLLTYLIFTAVNGVVNGMGEGCKIDSKIWDRVRGLAIGSLVFLIK